MPRRGGGSIKPGSPQSKDGFKVPQLPQKKTVKQKLRAAKRARVHSGLICGAKKRNGEKCTLAPGWGTPHPGQGACKFHGGSVPNHIKSAIKDEYRTLFGTPIEINPLDALIMCIKTVAGEVQWLGQKMAELDESAWVEQTIVGKQFHLYARERTRRMQDLARFSEMAIRLGIEERAIKLAETYGELLARLLQGILGDLELNAAQRAKAPSIISKHLLLIEGGAETIDLGDRKAIPQVAGVKL